MIIKHEKNFQKRVGKLLTARPTGVQGQLNEAVDQALIMRKKILALTKEHPTPFYAFDIDALENRIQEFNSALERHLPGCVPFYAMKTNYHPWILSAIAKHGWGIDVSSGRELQLALRHRPKRLLFSGPGKSDTELRLALRHRKQLIIHADSIGELQRLGKLSQKTKQVITAGVRIFIPKHGAWSKFGIPHTELGRAFREAQRYPYLHLSGIQFHISKNTNAVQYDAAFGEIASVLKTFPTTQQQLQFIDFGGGWYPNRTDGYYPWTASAPGSATLASIAPIVDSLDGAHTEFSVPYYITESLSIDAFAQALGTSLKKHFAFLPRCTFYTEPGRIIATPSMHIVLRVTDIKNPTTVILDGGVNITGWEYGLHYYNPIVNLTHPSRAEKKITLYGSLCAPYDVWGYYCFAKTVREGDVVLIPNQGAYRYALSQEFIKGIPAVYPMR